MASYPTTARTFASLSNGAVIQATDVGDARDEIAAIEDGLLNGTARLNSSNSTVATLSVVGGSTLAGALTVAGGSTLASLSVSGGSTVGTLNAGNSTMANLVVTGTLTATLLQTPTAVRLTHSVKTEVADNAWTGLNWDTELEDGSSMHSTTTNSSRITFAGSTGLYAVGASLEWSVTGLNGHRVVRFRVNDSSGVAGQGQLVSNAAAAVLPWSLTTLLRVADVTDYVTLLVLSNTGSTASIAPNSTAYGGPLFWAYKVSS